MVDQSKDRLFRYDFVVTVLWIGFSLAISFMETPLRFQANSITVPIALEIGRLVFHALNFAEIMFAGWIFCCQMYNGCSKRSRRLFVFAAIILVAQTLILFLVLDQRTAAIIAKEEVESAPYHTIYIVMEVVKLIALCVLAHSQLRDFKGWLSGSGD